MKRAIATIAITLALMLTACGPSVEEQEQDKVAHFALQKIHTDLEECEAQYKGWSAENEMDLRCFAQRETAIRAWAEIYPRQASILSESIKQTARDADKREMNKETK